MITCIQDPIGAGCRHSPRSVSRQTLAYPLPACVCRRLSYPIAVPGGNAAIGCLGGAAIRRLISIGEPRRATFLPHTPCKARGHSSKLLPLRFPVASVRCVHAVKHERKARRDARKPIRGRGYVVHR